MIQLHILDGKMAGRIWEARHLPVRIGRARRVHLRLEDPGVWDHHLELGYDPGRGVVLSAHPEALVHLNGDPVCQAVLRNDDVIQLGGVRLRFGLSEIRPRPFRVREALIWLGLGLVTAGQLALIYWLAQ